MKLLDIIKISQTNLLRAKLRTFLTVVAVFIGALTLSLTNGLGSGIRSYVDEQLGNLGAENTLIVRVKQPNQNPLSTDVTEYNPNNQMGQFNIALLDEEDITTLEETEGVENVVPLYLVQIDYITAGDKKYAATASQYVDNFEITMAAGEIVSNSEQNTIAIPHRYVEPLGFSSDEDAVGKKVRLGFKNSLGDTIEKELVVSGVLEQSLLGNSDTLISNILARQIYGQQTNGVPNLEGRYMNAFVTYNPEYSKEEVQALKDKLAEHDFAGQTISEQIGMVSKVIDTILIVLNIFGVIALLAAAFGIVNTQLMSVNERTSEIGLMKALGAGRKTIFAMFSLEAASIGFWGAVLGAGVSIVIGTIASTYASNNFLKDFVGFQLIAFPVIPTIAVILGIMFLAFLAGALPSLKASRLDPIKALRHE